MPKEFIILLIIIVLVLVIGIGIYYYLSQGRELSGSPTTPTERPEETYSDVVTGVISFSEDKVTVKTEDGKEYWLYPPRPISYYEDMKIKNGQEVEIQGKILEGQRVLVKTIK